MTGEPMPSWVNPNDMNLPEWVWRTGHAAAQLEETIDGTTLPPVLIWRWLLGYSGLKFGPRSTAMWLSTWVGGRTKTAEPGRVRGTRLHCFPKVEQIAARSGASDRAVRQHLLELERTGWLIIERHRITPSDYWIAVPDADLCPCGCEEVTERDSGASPADSANSPADSAAQTGENCRTDRQILPTHLVQALGSSNGSEHLRSVSQPSPHEASNFSDERTKNEEREDVGVVRDTREDDSSLLVDRATDSLEQYLALAATKEEEELAHDAWRQRATADGLTEQQVRRCIVEARSRRKRVAA